MHQELSLRTGKHGQVPRSEDPLEEENTPRRSRRQKFPGKRLEIASANICIQNETFTDGSASASVSDEPLSYVKA